MNVNVNVNVNVWINHAVVSLAATVTVRSAMSGEKSGRMLLRGSMATGYVWVDTGSNASTLQSKHDGEGAVSPGRGHDLLL